MNRTPILCPITTLALFLVLALGPVGQAFAQGRTVINVDKSGLAVQGYDVAAYFTDGKPEKGNTQFASTHGGASAS